ncbi:MAG: acetyl-CoA carboxylase biotin carboxyl carrier protein subunit [Dehalococcoidia bacterium]|nr:acetyl-CoA carboxylase biotin carboxyl carrier protein subunit [Dehalococcoidia bacterium]
MAQQDVTAPMRGTMLEVLVSPGDTVTPGMELAIIESMKNVFLVEAESTGVVTEVLVSQGQSVEEGDALLRWTRVEMSRPTRAR